MGLAGLQDFPFTQWAQSDSRQQASVAEGSQMSCFAVFWNLLTLKCLVLLCFGELNDLKWLFCRAFKSNNPHQPNHPISPQQHYVIANRSGITPTSFRLQSVSFMIK
eukprot:2468790-Amphidinium_carterae.1